MKQRISVEDLMQLTEEQQQKLKDWLTEKSMTSIMPDLSMCQIDIGQMIELLTKIDECLTMTRMITFIDDTEKWGYEAQLRHLHKWYNAEELADCLWSAVKEVL